MSSREVITSSSNARIKGVAQLTKKANKRREAGVFIVEGTRMVTEAPLDSLVNVYVSATLLDKDQAVLRFVESCETSGVDVTVVSPEVFKSMSDTVTPQGILAIVKCKSYEVLESADAFLLLEDVQDPGNLGTLFRTAEAAGINEIIMSRGCVDIYNPKTIRSTMGTIYRMPHIICADDEQWCAVIESLKSRGVVVYGGALERSEAYDVPDYTKPVGFVIGNEGNGITDNTLSMINRVHIPMLGEIESLNAAMAGGILMYEMSRQRRND